MQTGVITTGGDVSLQAQTLSECLKETYQLSGALIHNICDGTQYFVPHGFIDYIEMFLEFGIFSALIGLIVVTTWGIFQTYDI